MSRLIVFGDSFAYGQGLDPDVETSPTPHPNSWPYLLGEHLGITEIFNFSQPGCSNKVIWHFALNFQYKPTDIVVMSWTNNQRTATIESYTNAPLHKNMMQNKDHRDYSNNVSFLNFGPWMEEDFAINYYVKSNRYSHLDAWIETCSYFEHANMYVKQFTKNVFNTALPGHPQFLSLLEEGTKQYEIEECKAYEDMLWSVEDDPELTPHWMFHDIACTMNPEFLKYPKGHDNSHMGLEGNEHFAYRLFKLINMM